MSYRNFYYKVFLIVKCGFQIFFPIIIAAFNNKDAFDPESNLGITFW